MGQILTSIPQIYAAIWAWKIEIFLFTKAYNKYLIRWKERKLINEILQQNFNHSTKTQWCALGLYKTEFDTIIQGERFSSMH